MNGVIVCNHSNTKDRIDRLRDRAWTAEESLRRAASIWGGARAYESDPDGAHGPGRSLSESDALRLDVAIYGGKVS